MSNTEFNLKMNEEEEKETSSEREEILAEYEVDEEDDDYEEMSSSKSSSINPMNKMMFLVIGAIVIIFLIIMIFMMLLGGSKSYDDIEQIMANAAERYFAAHPESLPAGTSSVDISAAELSNAGYMKPLEKYLPDGAVCTGSVNVQKSGASYLYTPKLDCGETYRTSELYSKVLNDNKIVTSGYGLYNKAGNKVFRGEEVNNYVQLDKSLWRIVKITSKNEVVLVIDNYENNSVPWDDRYNQTVNYESGINNFAVSRVKESLKKYYELAEDSKDAVFLSDADKTKLVSFGLCTGKRGAEEQGTDNAIECREKAKDQKVGLLTVSEYMAASTDSNCKTASSAACQNYNYLVNGAEWWTITAIKENTYQAYTVDTDGDIEVKNVNNYADLRPVIYLNSKVLYKDGEGTLEKPYLIK